MKAWVADPELLATFRAEVQDRLTSLADGLLALEAARSPRSAVAPLFRDAHTVKGSARMLGLDALVAVAHAVEDLLGAVRDGRLAVSRELVDLLLVAVEALRRALPGAERGIRLTDLDPVAEALSLAAAGRAYPLPQLPAPREEPVEDARGSDPRADGPATVRVPARRVHDVLDLVGEAELEVRRVSRSTRELTALVEEHRALVRELRSALPEAHAVVASGERLAALADELDARAEQAAGRLAELRTGALSLAMVPLSGVTHGFPALVRDVAARLGADVRLEVRGQDVELDARVLDAVAEALRHLVVNAVDHGHESAEARLAAGKPAHATVTVAARAVGTTVVVSVSDDGPGIDEDRLRERAAALGLAGADASGPALWRLLFAPGFSTRAEVTETSGRGVGLDVVRTAAEDLGGTAEIASVPGHGTTVTLTLPVTLGVLRCLLAQVGTARYAVPLAGVVETLSLAGEVVHDVAGVRCLQRHGRTVPLVELSALLGLPAGRATRRSAVVVRHGSDGNLLAFAVDRLEREQEIVVKDLGPFLGRQRFASAATIDTDGSVVLVLDTRELCAAHVTGRVAAPAEPERRAAIPAQRSGPAQVLVVEDSIGVRELQRVILESAGYAVATAVDGLDGAARLGGRPVDLVISDVEMPGMDGFTLTRTLRGTPGWENVPVVIMTSRGDDADRRAGLDAGASAYLLKSEFDQSQLLDTVRRLVGR